MIAKIHDSGITINIYAIEYGQVDYMLVGEPHSLVHLVHIYHSEDGIPHFTYKGKRYSLEDAILVDNPKRAV